MAKYRVTYEFRAVVRVNVEAENEKQAEEVGMDEADEGINSALELYDITVTSLK